MFYTLELNVSIQIDYSCLTDELITWQKTAENWRCWCCFTSLWLSIHDEIRESNTFWQSCKKVSKHRFYKKPLIIHAIWETVHSQWHGLTPVIPVVHSWMILLMKRSQNAHHSTCFYKLSVKHYPKRIHKTSFVECCIFNDNNAF